MGKRDLSTHTVLIMLKSITNALTIEAWNTTITTKTMRQTELLSLSPCLHPSEANWT